MSKKRSKKSAPRGASSGKSTTRKPSSAKVPPRKVSAKSPARKALPARGRTSGRVSAPTERRAMVARVIDLVKFARKTLDEMASGIPDSRATEQLPGASNHKLWTYGHLATATDWFAGLIDGKPTSIPESYQGLFGMGSAPKPNAAAYPPLGEVRAVADASFRRVLDALSVLSDRDLFAPVEGDGAGFATDKLDAAVKGLWHEGWHLGQLAALRRGMGLPPMMS